jgi:amino acid transporter
LLDDDAGQLAALGVKSEFKREMGLWGNFALGFTYLSPVVGVYTLFAYALATAGPAMFWAFPLVGFGQLLVAFIFSEVVSQYPVAGGIYPWARRLWGRKYAWMTGWVYLWALLATIAAVAYGSGTYFSALIGVTPTSGSIALAALLILAVATIFNYFGTRVLARAAIFGFAAEIIGCVVVGAWLLIGHREQSIRVIFHSFGAGKAGNYLPAFFAGALIAIWMYYGFEACGDVAEEVPNPGRTIPKAIRRTIYVGGAAGTFICLSLVLAVSNFGAVISGKQVDPVGNVLSAAFGTVGSKIVIGVILISFLSCTMSLQAAASRMAYSYARDKMIMGHGLLSRFSERAHIPPYAVGLAVVIPAAIIVLSLASANATAKIISFAALGIYVAFQMVVFAALRARVKGWKPAGAWKLGAWAYPVNIVALVYGVAAMVDMLWPRSPGTPFIDNYIVLVSTLIVMGVGLLYMVAARPYMQGEQPYSDAIENRTGLRSVPAGGLTVEGAGAMAMAQGAVAPMTAEGATMTAQGATVTSLTDRLSGEPMPGSGRADSVDGPPGQLSGDESPGEDRASGF